MKLMASGKVSWPMGKTLSLSIARARRLFGTSLLVGWLLGGTAEVARATEILGWMEEARIYPGGVVLHAKLDTGADHPSQDADVESQAWA